MIPPETVTAADAMKRILAGVRYPSCDGCTACCHHAWLLEEERRTLEATIPGEIGWIDGVPLLDHDGPCHLLSNAGCRFYAERPLDCRLFPLDIIEEEGDYWWVLYDECPRRDAMGERLIPVIPELEAHLGVVFEEYQRQIAVLKTRYDPYSTGAYRKVDRVRCR